MARRRPRMGLDRDRHHTLAGYSARRRRGAACRRAVAVVLSQGMEKRLEVPQSTVDWLEARGVTVHVAETTEAIELYNRLRGTTAVAGLFHSTC